VSHLKNKCRRLRHQNVLSFLKKKSFLEKEFLKIAPSFSDLPPLENSLAFKGP
jgi:hypothetical protein